MASDTFQIVIPAAKEEILLFPFPVSQFCGMKFQVAIDKMRKIFTGSAKKSSIRLVESQRFLLAEGHEAFAEVMDTSLIEEKVGNMLTIRLWLKLKKVDGKFIFIHTQTLAPLNQIPGKGQQIKIKYLPDNLSSILILA